MVIAQKVERSVNEKVRELLIKSNIPPGCLAAGRFKGNGDISQKVGLNIRQSPAFHGK